MKAPLLHDDSERGSQAAHGGDEPLPLGTAAPQLEEVSTTQPFSHHHAVCSPPTHREHHDAQPNGHREHGAQPHGSSSTATATANATATRRRRRPGLAQQTEEFFTQNDTVDDNGRERQEQILTTDDYYLAGDNPNPNPQLRREFLLRHTLSYWASVSFMVGSEML